MISALRSLEFALLCAFVLLHAWTPLCAQEDLVDLEDQAIRAAVARVAPAVVRLETFGGLERVGRTLVGDGPTTGVIVSPEGWVISSAFNFAKQPTSILVTLPDGQRAPAEIVARDLSRMLVLLKIETSTIEGSYGACSPHVRLDAWLMVSGFVPSHEGISSYGLYIMVD